MRRGCRGKWEDKFNGGGGGKNNGRGIKESSVANGNLKERGRGVGEPFEDQTKTTKKKKKKFSNTEKGGHCSQKWVKKKKEKSVDWGARTDKKVTQRSCQGGKATGRRALQGQKDERGKRRKKRHHTSQEGGEY